MTEFPVIETQDVNPGYRHIPLIQLLLLTKILFSG